MKTEYYVIGIISLIVVGLAVFGGYHLKKDKVCPEIKTDTVYVTKTDTIHQAITMFIKAKADTVFVDSKIQSVNYSELIDSAVIFKSDSLDFVAEIVFNDSTKAFNNFFDFNLRIKRQIEEIWHEVPIHKTISNQFFIEGGAKTSDKLYYYGKAGFNAINENNFKIPIYYQLEGREKMTHSVYAGLRLEL